MYTSKFGMYNWTALFKCLMLIKDSDFSCGFLNKGAIMLFSSI